MRREAPIGDHTIGDHTKGDHMIGDHTKGDHMTDATPSATECGLLRSRL